jgi:hypothetical protein
MCFRRHLAKFIILSVLLLRVTDLVAQTVALTRFGHVDYERNDPIVDDTIKDQLLVRLAAETPYQFVERAAVDRLIAEQALSREGFGRADGAARLGKFSR